jgi:hypothetical protein
MARPKSALISTIDAKALGDVLPNYGRLSVKEREVMAFYAVGVPLERIAASVSLKMDDVKRIVDMNDPHGKLPANRSLQFALAFSQATINTIYFMQQAIRAEKEQSPLEWMQTAKLQLEIACKLKELLPIAEESDKGQATMALERLEGKYGE